MTASAESKPSARAGGFVMPEMFLCDRLNARLSVPACAARWRKAAARRPDPWDSLTHCRGCPIGAAHAGVALEAVELDTDAWRSVCCRCLHLSDRIIQGRFCPSCYNRHREAGIGRNRKGGRPSLIDRLGTVSVAVTRGSQVEVVTAERVTGPVEVLVQFARETMVPLAFGRPGHVWDAPALRTAPAEVDPAPTEGVQRLRGAEARDQLDGARRPPPGRPTLRHRLLASTARTPLPLLAKWLELEAALPVGHP